MSSLFAVSDTWLVISEYLTPSSIASLSQTCQEANTVINHPSVWEQQCARLYHTDPISDDNPSSKSIDYKGRIRKFIEKYGSHSIFYYHRVRRCWDALSKWSEVHLPSLMTTFNPPASDHDIQSLKNALFGDDQNGQNVNINHSDSLTPYLLFLGECANGQQLEAKHSRMGLFGYYSFYRKASVGQLLSIQDAIRYTELVHDRYSDDFSSGRKRHGRHAQNVKNAQNAQNVKVESFAKSEMSRSVSDSKMNQSTSSKQRDEVQLEDLWLYTAGLPGGGRRISVPCLTFLDRVSGEIFKITQDATLWHPQHGNTTSFLDHLEWYLFENLLANNYRIDTEQGICRFPLDDLATSQCITKGVLCRASPIFVAEISNLRHVT